LALRSDSSPVVRCEVVDSFMRIGLSSDVVLMELSYALDDVDSNVRMYAARALGMLGKGKLNARMALIEALADGSPDVRETAAVALGLILPLDDEAMAILTRALNDVDERVRRAAAYSLSLAGK